MSTSTTPQAARAAPPEPAYLIGVHQGWHAVTQFALKYTAAMSSGTRIAYAECGALVRVSKHGPYRRGGFPVMHDPCIECAWAVAGETGQLDEEIRRLMPSNEDREVFTRLGVDPLTAVTAATMLAEAARSGHGDYGADHPATIQMLAMITRHAPVILVPEDCAEGSCEHYPPGYDPLTGKGFECPRPEASAACAACSLQAGSWAGEWEGRYELGIPAPCAVLTRLAEHAEEALAEAKRRAEAATQWEREQARPEPEA